MKAGETEAGRMPFADSKCIGIGIEQLPMKSLEGIPDANDEVDRACKLSQHPRNMWLFLERC